MQQLVTNIELTVISLIVRNCKIRNLYFLSNHVILRTNVFKYCYNHYPNNHLSTLPLRKICFVVILFASSDTEIIEIVSLLMKTIQKFVQNRFPSFSKNMKASYCCCEFESAAVVCHDFFGERKKSLFTTCFPTVM